MTQHKWFFKLMIIIATLSLILVALAPVIYTFAPQVSITGVDTAVGESVPAE